MTNPFLNPQPAAPTGNPFTTPAQPAPPAFPGALSPAEQQQVAQTSYRQATGQQATPPALDLGRLGSVGAPVVGEGGGPKLRDMYGRLVLFFPLSLTRVPQYIGANVGDQRKSADGLRDQLTATAVVLDDGRGGQGPIAFGGNLTAFPPVQHTESAPLPYIRRGMWITQSRIISQLRDGLPVGPGAAPDMRVGRVSKAGPAHNDAWELIGATEAEVALVRQYLEAVQAGQLPHPLAP